MPGATLPKASACAPKGDGGWVAVEVGIMVGVAVAVSVGTKVGVGVSDNPAAFASKVVTPNGEPNCVDVGVTVGP